MIKKLLSFLLVLVSTLTFSACADNDDDDLVKEWPADAFDFMEGVPEFNGEQYHAKVDKDYEMVTVYYKEATLDEVESYIEQLKDFGLEENVSTTVNDGKYQWSSVFTEGELFVELFWYDTAFELESGSYDYSLVIKFAEF